MSTTITGLAGTYTQALEYPNGRHIDVDSVGRRWVGIQDQGSIRFFYSASPSTPGWSGPTGIVDTYGTGATPFSFYVDEDDGFHLVYVGTSGNIYFEYRYGTESGGTLTWSSAVQLGTGNVVHSLDVVAHKLGSDYWAHCFMTNNPQGMWFRRVKITGGTPVAQGSIVRQSTLGVYGVSADFRHPLASKAVAASSPDVFVAATHSASLYFWKYTYSAGPTWTVAATQTIGTAVAPRPIFGNGTLGFDGTAVQMAFLRTDLAGVELVERDLADVTTTNRGASPVAGNYLLPTLVWDSDRNVYLVGIDSVSSDPKWIKWTRATATWDSSWTTIEAISGSYASVSALRTPSTSALEVVYGRNFATDDVVWAEATTLPKAGFGWGMVPIGG